jgi:hypothetical protein
MRMTVKNENCIPGEYKTKLIRGMLANIQFRIFYLSVFLFKKKKSGD